MSNERFVFISYASKDKIVAQSLCNYLEKNDLNCWIAPRDIPPGKDYADAIIDGITHSRVMIVLFSETSNVSNHVKNEVERAFNKKIEIIPFRISNIMPTSSFEYFLSTKHWLDGFEKKPAYYFPELLKICKSITLQDLTYSNEVSTAKTTKKINTNYRNVVIGSIAFIICIIFFSFFWNSNSFKNKVTSTSNDTVKFQPPVTDKTEKENPIENSISNKKTSTLNSKKENTATDAFDVKPTTMKEPFDLDGASFSNSVNNNRIRLTKLSNGYYQFEGEIDNTELGGQIKFVGNSIYKITSNEIKGSFTIRNNQMNGDITFIELNYKAKDFELHKY